MTPVLDIAVRHRLGDFTLDSSFTSDGRLTGASDPRVPGLAAPTR